jgi:hypothetical protein
MKLLRLLPVLCTTLFLTAQQTDGNPGSQGQALSAVVPFPPGAVH